MKISNIERWKKLDNEASGSCILLWKAATCVASKQGNAIGRAKSESCVLETLHFIINGHKFERESKSSS